VVTSAHHYVVRLWLPDRPGVLGLVASRMGAVGGDVVGIEIIDRGAGVAVDELVVALADPALVDLLIKEIREVDGVDIEEIRELGRGRRLDRIALLDAAAELCGAETLEELDERLVARVHVDLGASWTALVDIGSRQVITSLGELPSEQWAVAFAFGASNSPSMPATGGGKDVAWSAVTPDILLTVGRQVVDIRQAERDELAGFARLAGVRRTQLLVSGRT
jgi:hypothetical protein